jgi:hypothetical protein
MPWLTALLLSAGLLIRLVALDNPTLSFHATRQYRSAIIARALYYRTDASTSAARKHCASAELERQGELEPPLIEWLSAVGYRLLGHEALAVPRLLATAFWLIGTLLWMALVRQLFSAPAALVAGAFVLFLPFGVIASRSFQPDPLMLMLLMTSVAAISRLEPGCAYRRTLAATLVTGLAIVVKPYSVFLVGAALVARCLSGRPVREWATWSGTWILLTLGFVLPTSYYARGLFTGSLGSQASLSFQPALWQQPDFWQGWRDMLEQVFGMPSLIAGVGGVLVAPGRAARLLLGALVLGYVAYGLTFAYHISTHDYYQLPLIPVLALSWAGLVERGIQLSRRPRLRWLRPAAVLLGAVLLVRTAREIESSVFEQLRSRDDAAIAFYEQVGAALRHSCRVVFIATDSYGQPLLYHGEIGGWGWPTVRDASRRAQLSGHKPPNPRVRLREYRKQGAEFFVSTSLAELHGQPSLRRELDERYRVVSRTEGFIIYDLR